MARRHTAIRLIARFSSDTYCVLRILNDDEVIGGWAIDGAFKSDQYARLRRKELEPAVEELNWVESDGTCVAMTLNFEARSARCVRERGSVRQELPPGTFQMHPDSGSP